MHIAHHLYFIMGNLLCSTMLLHAFACLIWKNMWANTDWALNEARSRTRPPRPPRTYSTCSIASNCNKLNEERKKSDDGGGDGDGSTPKSIANKYVACINFNHVSIVMLSPQKLIRHVIRFNVRATIYARFVSPSVFTHRIIKLFTKHNFMSVTTVFIEYIPCDGMRASCGSHHLPFIVTVIFFFSLLLLVLANISSLKVCTFCFLIEMICKCQ